MDYGSTPFMSIIKQQKREMEKEASVFAACILIPRDFILQDIRDGFDLGDDNRMKELCKKYGVTATTMTLRLSLLKHQL